MIPTNLKKENFIYPLRVRAPSVVNLNLLHLVGRLALRGPSVLTSGCSAVSAAVISIAVFVNAALAVVLAVPPFAVVDGDGALAGVAHARQAAALAVAASAGTATGLSSRCGLCSRGRSSGGGGGSGSGKRG